MNELTEKQRYWQEHLAAAESFEGPLTDYAKLHDLDVKKLYVFKGVLEKKTAAEVVEPTGFVRVSPQPKTPVTGHRLEVVLINGVQLSLPDAPGLLERLAKL